jgi:hypothetical protein
LGEDAENDVPGEILNGSPDGICGTGASGPRCAARPVESNKMAVSVASGFPINHPSANNHPANVAYVAHAIPPPATRLAIKSCGRYRAPIAGGFQHFCVSVYEFAYRLYLSEN